MTLNAACILVASSSSMWPQFCLPPLPLFFPLGLFCCMPRGARFHPICIFPRTSSHFNWLKKCSRRHASPIISQRGYLCISKQLPQKKMLFIVRGLRFRHHSLLSCFKTSIVQGAGALLMNMSDLTFLDEQTIH